MCSSRSTSTTPLSPSLLQQVALAGASSLTATLVTHPIDTLKLRTQLRGLSARAPPIAATHGLYAGLSPALLRAATYSATRLGLYHPLRASFAVVAGVDAREPSLHVKLAACVASGVAGAVVGNPCELIKVRTQHADNRAYDGIRHALATIVTRAGPLALWTGTYANALRAVLLTASQLLSYDHVKTMLKKRVHMSEGVRMHFAAAMVAGLVTTTVSTPADVVKSLVMHSKPTRSSVECARLVFATDGMCGFMRGWVANYARLGPNSLITFVVYERLRTIFGLTNI